MIPFQPNFVLNCVFVFYCVSGARRIPAGGQDCVLFVFVYVFFCLVCFSCLIRTFAGGQACVYTCFPSVCVSVR